MIKCLCVELGENDAKFKFSGSLPKIGRHYVLQDITEGTPAQNGTYHLILKLFYTFMLENDLFVIEDNNTPYDLRCSSWESLKDVLKRHYGRGFEVVKYVNSNYEMIDALDVSEVPEYVMQDLKINGNTKRVLGLLYSWSDYDLQDRRSLIGITLLLMDRFGVDTEEYQELRKCFDRKTIAYFKEKREEFKRKIKRSR